MKCLVHNSGHYSIEGCNISPIRASGKNFKKLYSKYSNLLNPSIMLNLLGDLWINNNPNFDFNSQKNIFLHLYNKTEPG